MSQGFALIMDLPPGVSPEQMAAWIKEALITWKEVLDPNDSVLKLDVHGIVVFPVRKSFNKDDTVKIKGE